jgi:hypothetical protein
LLFTGTNEASYQFDLVGNSDIRDYNNDGWTNNINGTTTINVVSLSGGQHRLDMQTITLPGSFLGQTLLSIDLVDNGPGFQRTIPSGVTVGSSAVPLPGTLGLLSSGRYGLMVAGWWRRRQN